MALPSYFQDKRVLPTSGAPLLAMLRRTSPLVPSQKWYLTGILVHGDGYPGKRKTFPTDYEYVGYLKIGMFIDWINDTIERRKNQ